MGEWLKAYKWWLLAAVAILAVAVALTVIAGQESEPTTLAPTATLTPTYNVKDYGATANDSSNDEAAILKAIAAAKGAIVYFPQGNYAVGPRFKLPLGAVVKGDTVAQSYLMVTTAKTDGTFTWKFTWVKP